MQGESNEITVFRKYYQQSCPFKYQCVGFLIIHWKPESPQYADCWVWFYVRYCYSNWGSDGYPWPLSWVNPEGTWRADWYWDTRVNDWIYSSIFLQQTTYINTIPSWQQTICFKREQIFSSFTDEEMCMMPKPEKKIRNYLLVLLCLRKLNPKFQEIWAKVEYIKISLVLNIYLEVRNNFFFPCKFCLAPHSFFWSKLLKLFGGTAFPFFIVSGWLLAFRTKLYYLLRVKHTTNFS